MAAAAAAAAKIVIRDIIYRCRALGQPIITLNELLKESLTGAEQRLNKVMNTFPFVIFVIVNTGERLKTNIGR